LESPIFSAVRLCCPGFFKTGKVLKKLVYNKVSGGEIQGRMTKAENAAFVKTQGGLSSRENPVRRKLWR
jgi:hypothetical protein